MRLFPVPTDKPADIGPLLCAGATLLLMATMLAARAVGYPRLGMAFTVLASSGFLTLAGVRGAYRHGYGRAMLAALTGCWIGDLIGPYHFMAGLAAFLIAHFGFITAFCISGLDKVRLSIAAPLIALIIIALAFWLFPHVPAGERPPVIAYLAVISTMILCAAGARRRPATTLAFTAAVIFFLSDIFVARWRYVVPDGINAYFCYPLYYLACTLFAWNAGSPLRNRRISFRGFGG